MRSSRRDSYSPRINPWYGTEALPLPGDGTETQLIESPGSRAKGARPAPSYTEKDVWTYKGRRFGGVFELTDKASIDFLDAWEIQLQPDFGFPRAIEMTNSAGSPSLVNSTAFVAGRFDAETSSVEKEHSTLVLSILAYWARGKTWYKKRILFAEGVYQFSRGQDPSILVESMRVGGVVEEC